MKGNQQLIDFLNVLLAMERTGEDQYKIHRAMFQNWQLARAVIYYDERIGDEGRHITLLENRILFLEGSIVPGLINEVKIGKVVRDMFLFDQDSEAGAIAAYNKGIALAVELGDEDTAQMLRSILADETDHIDDIQARLNQQSLMGDQNWFASQSGEVA